eukprot:697531-Heterocapsa_arctica.AAC.1
MGRPTVRCRIGQPQPRQQKTAYYSVTFPPKTPFSLRVLHGLRRRARGEITCCDKLRARPRVVHPHPARQ